MKVRTSAKVSFLADRRGTTMMLFAAVFPMMCFCIGAAVDFARHSNAQSQTKAAVDAAVLAGARTLALTDSESAAIASAQFYYTQNVTGRLPTTNDTVEFQVKANKSEVTASGNVSLEMTFLKMAGINDLPLLQNAGSSFAKAEIRGGGGSDLEVSVMLDVTGSMCADGKGPCTTGTKIDALKTAATELVNIVVRDNQAPYKSRVALVPFAKRIRMAPDGDGATIMKKLTNLDATWSGWKRVCDEYGATTSGSGESGGSTECLEYDVEYQSNLNIKPCVTDRFYDNPWAIDTTDEAPGFGRWMNAYQGRRSPVSEDSSDTASTTGLGLVEEDPSDNYNWDNGGYCSTPEENQIVPLSSDKSMLVNKINGLKAYGSTGGALGTAFSWYTLTSKWSGIWTGGSAPANNALMTTMQANGAPQLRKVAILMSDGVYNTYRGWDGKDQQEMSDYALEICTAMKAAGIEIYTVAFDLDSLTATERTIAEATLKACGTDIDHFYNTLNASELQTAFRDIAVKLTSVVLTD
ncbi:MAG: hypothetical protein K0U74_02020 [Alphaproteobacteria bacterium]|nr:hypothetical protein [Alphaproteobacteria bacterium]